MKTALRIMLIAITAAACATWLLTSAGAQKRRNVFFHSTAAHKKIDCASCHKTPTANSQAVRGFPDVADYPGHASCIGCHRNDFFSGNRPEICSICHTAPSPRNSARFPFPVRSRPHEFTTIFPHDIHQDIIAGNENPDGTAPSHFTAINSLSGARMSSVRPAHFVNASFNPFALPADEPPQFTNCAICHQTTAALPKFGNRKPSEGRALADAANESFAPGAGFFKDAPEGHASCFTCHYQGQKPTRTDCAGCHRPAARFSPSDVILRYSLKFDHQSANHVNKDCTTCHVRITQNSDVAAMKDADVPFMTCASCHAAQLKEETDKRDAGTQPVFQCTYCHNPEIGRFEIPASHRNR